MRNATHQNETQTWSETMKTAIRDAIQLFRTTTDDHCDPWALAGRANAATRARIMSGLAGKRMPQSKSGVNALRKALASAVGVKWESGECMHEYEENIKAKLLATASS